jgi:hypothetical protein
MDGKREDPPVPPRGLEGRLKLAYMTFPREHWPRIASTNPLERLNGEIK